MLHIYISSTITNKSYINESQRCRTHICGGPKLSPHPPLFQRGNVKNVNYIN